jgi:hypothetical protein
MKRATKDHTTLFEDFLDSNDIESQEEKEALAEAVLKRTESGNVKCWEHNGQIFVEGWSDMILRIANEKAKDQFLRQLRALPVEDGMDEAS